MWACNVLCITPYYGQEAKEKVYDFQSRPTAEEFLEAQDRIGIIMKDNMWRNRKFVEKGFFGRPFFFKRVEYFMSD